MKYNSKLYTDTAQKRFIQIFLDYIKINTGDNIIIYHAMKFNFEHKIKLYI